MKNFIIGIGGTGAKCLEHLVHCCTAGLGPDQLWVGMVDQDEANGNVSRTKVLLSKYVNLQSNLKDESTNYLGTESKLFKTTISTNSDSVWLPLKGADPTLEQVIQYDLLKPEVKGLIDCLYDPEEKKQNLSEGFRARPNIGAAAMLATTSNQDDPFWSQIYKAIDNARSGEEVRIFIISSIFGGTGASGFPNIARKIRAIQLEKNITSNVHLGGALMLPYFTYNVPDENMEGEIFARPEEFLDQTKGALEYYSKLFQHNKIFDQVYVTGWDPLAKLPNFKMGGNLQNNPPLFPELYAALGAMKFFNENTKISSNQEIFHIGKNDENEIIWSDIPNVSGSLNSKEKIAQLLRFAFINNYIYLPALSGTWTQIKKYSDENWFKRLVFAQTYDHENKQSKIGHQSYQEILNQLRDYSQEVLKWFSDLHYSSVQNTDQKIKLIFADFFTEYNLKDNANRVKLAEKLNSSQKKNFNQLITDNSNFTLLNVMRNVCYKKIKKDQKGLGVFADMLFRSCER